MNSILLRFFLGLSFFPVIVLAQEKVATILPGRPKLGDTLQVTYYPDAPYAKLHGVSSITAELLFLRADELEVLHEVPMKKQGAAWTASLPFTDEKCSAILLRFSAGDIVDDNGGDAWMAMVYSAYGKPVKNAQYFRAEAAIGGDYWGFRKQTDLEAAKLAVAEEMKTYPKNVFAFSLQFFLMTRSDVSDTAGKRLVEMLDDAHVRYMNEPRATDAFLQCYRIIEDHDKVRELLVKLKAEYSVERPSKLSRRRLLNYEASDPKETEIYLREVKSYFNDYPDDQDMQDELVRFARERGRTKEVLEILESLPHPDGMIYITMNENRMTDFGIMFISDLDSTVAQLKKGIDRIRTRDEAMKPPYKSTREWRKNKCDDLGKALGLYGFGLSRLHHWSEALPAYAEAYCLTSEHDTIFSEHYLECLMQESRYEEALNIGLACIEKSEASRKILMICDSAYRKLNGTASGLEVKLHEARNAPKKLLRERLQQNMLRQTAADFTMKGFERRSVTFAELKGKVIVLEFWATWCGPCRMSLPVLQEVYERFRDNSDVIFLVADTWERVDADRRLELVQGVLEKGRYTFPVYLDDDVTANRYGVDGVPTKFVIDREGKIRFRFAGFEGAQQMEEELTMQIEMLLEEGKSGKTD